MGIAAVNIQDTTTTLIVTVRDVSGQVEEGPKEIVLQPREQLARYTHEERVELDLPDDFDGSLWVEVKEPGNQVALTAVRQSPGVLTTFPVISLDQAVTVTN